MTTVITCIHAVQLLFQDISDILLLDVPFIETYLKEKQSLTNSDEHL